MLLLFPKYLLLSMSKTEWWLSWLFGLTQYTCVYAKELCLLDGKTDPYLCTLNCSPVNMQRTWVPVLDDWSLKVFLYCGSLGEWRDIIAEEQICSVWPGSLMKVCRKWFIMYFNWWHEMFLHFVSHLILPTLELLSRSMRWGRSPGSVSVTQNCRGTIHQSITQTRDWDVSYL